MRFKGFSIWMIALACVQFCIQGPAYSQDPLRLISPTTQVSKIAFKFPEGNPTFESDQLLEQMVTTGPSFWDRFDRLNPFVKPDDYPFDPIELQKDVVRLRQFLARNGFPTPRISYSASQYNAEKDRIRIILAIWEGEPLFIQDIRFFDQDSAYIAPQLPDDLQTAWMRFRDAIRQSTGIRYTDVERIRMQDQVLSWFQNHGYAFAEVLAESRTDTTQRTVDLSFFVDRGPRGRVSTIDLQGNEQVSDNVLLRELPFRVGDSFSASELRKGQQELFGLNLFRVALTDVPEQPRDSTVEVRIRVTEAKRRYLTAETGFSRQDGISIQGEWLNRNFFGSARSLSISMLANTGFLSANSAFDAGNVVGKLPPRLFRTTVSVRQPYLFTTKLSLLFSPFIEFQNDPQLAASEEVLDINRRETGLNATLIYETLPFRPISLQYTLSRQVNRIGFTTNLSNSDFYNKSVLGLSGTFGKTDNYINPSRGYLIKPFIETAGRLLTSGVQYNKTGIEAIAYVPVTRRLNVSGRIFTGTLWTFGKSQEALGDRFCTLLGAESGRSDLDTEQCILYENRFDPIFFYAGGGNDVRGWNFQLLGPKISRADTLRQDGEIVLDENGNPRFENYYYERLGGITKLIGNLELRTRVPGMGPDWQGAAFFDVGQVANDGLSLRGFRYSTGLGLRYATLVGFIRLDIAYKLNPSNSDLTDPEEAFLYANGLTDTPPRQKFFRRFGLHVSIGQAF